MSSIPLLLQTLVQRTIRVCFLRAVDANRTELLAPGWEAKTSASQRGTGEYSLYQVSRCFSSRETLVSTAGAFTSMRSDRSFVVFLAGSLGEGQPCGPLREAAGGATEGEIRR